MGNKPEVDKKKMKEVYGRAKPKHHKLRLSEIKKVVTSTHCNFFIFLKNIFYGRQY